MSCSLQQRLCSAIALLAAMPMFCYRAPCGDAFPLALVYLQQFICFAIVLGLLATMNACLMASPDTDSICLRGRLRPRELL